MNLTTKLAVATAVGAALYGIGGLPMFGVPVFANTTLKPAMAILAMFSVLFGPVVGFLVGFIGHWVTDLFAGWGVWLTWILGSGIVGAGLGLYPKLTKNALAKGELTIKQFGLFVALAFGSNVIGYGCAAFLDTVLFAEPFMKVFIQLCIIAAGNTLLIGVVGFFLLKMIAKRNAQNQNLSETQD